jgi:hypothetical protein
MNITRANKSGRRSQQDRINENGGAERAGVEAAHGKENPRALLCDKPHGPTRVSSPRQLPTDHDHDGGPQGPIREYQSDQPSQ